ncbi:MAG: hypothetical protein ABI651_17260 [Verrucomicrobiota bacterium]
MTGKLGTDIQRWKDLAGTSRCDVPARVRAGGTNGQGACESCSALRRCYAARTARRAIPTGQSVVD